MRLEDLSPEQQERYLAEDIQVGSLWVGDLARAWKLLSVLRDTALTVDPPDTERVIKFEAAASELAVAIRGLGMPLPRDSNGMTEDERIEAIEAVMAHLLDDPFEPNSLAHPSASTSEFLSTPAPAPRRRSSYQEPDEYSTSEDSPSAYRSPVPDGYVPRRLEETSLEADPRERDGETEAGDRPEAFEAASSSQAEDDEDDILDLTHWGE